MAKVLGNAKTFWLWKKKLVRYEYKCPWCGYVNIRYHPCRRIVCDKCGISFWVI